MTTTLTIHLSDADYQAVRVAAAQANQTPEELIAATVAERFGANGQTRQDAWPAPDPLIQFMRERGHLVDPRSFPPPPQLPNMPPYGTPEWKAMLEEFDEDTEDEVDWTRINLADFVER
jgi:hypothetical protein